MIHDGIGRVLSPSQICWYHSLSRNWEQRFVRFFYIFYVSVQKIFHFSFCQFKKQPLIDNHHYWLGIFFRTVEKVPSSLAIPVSPITDQEVVHIALSNSALHASMPKAQPCKFAHFPVAPVIKMFRYSVMYSQVARRLISALFSFRPEW